MYGILGFGLSPPFGGFGAGSNSLLQGEEIFCDNPLISAQNRLFRSNGRVDAVPTLAEGHSGTSDGPGGRIFCDNPLISAQNRLFAVFGAGGLGRWVPGPRRLTGGYSAHTFFYAD